MSKTCVASEFSNSPNSDECVVRRKANNSTPTQKQPHAAVTKTSLAAQVQQNNSYFRKRARKRNNIYKFFSRVAGKRKSDESDQAVKFIFFVIINVDVAIERFVETDNTHVCVRVCVVKVTNANVWIIMISTFAFV